MLQSRRRHPVLPNRSHPAADGFPILPANEQTLAHHRFSQAAKPAQPSPPRLATNESPTPAATIRAIHIQVLSKQPSEARPPQPSTSGHTPPSMMPVLLQNLTTGHRSLATASQPPCHPNRERSISHPPIPTGAFPKPRQPRAPASKRPGDQKPSEARPQSICPLQMLAPTKTTR